MIIMAMKLNINKIILILIGASMIIFYIYFRFIVTKLPRDLMIQPQLILAVSYSCICIIFIFLTVRNLYLLYKVNYHITYTMDNRFIYLKYYLNKVIQLCYKSLKIIDDFIKHTLLINHTGKLLKAFGLILKRFLIYNSSNKYLIIYLLCNVIPRFFVLFMFSIDILYFHKFQYVYQFAWLLTIPLIYSYLLYTYKEFSEHNIHEILQDILIFRFDDKTIMNTQDVIDFTLTECKTKKYSAIPVELSKELTQICYNEGGDITLTLAYYIPQFNMFTKLRKIVDILEQLQTKYNIYFNLIRFFLYSMLWLYILIYTQSITNDTVNYIIELLLLIQDTQEPFTGLPLTFDNEYTPRTYER
jgi:hypothetical protein